MDSRAHRHAEPTAPTPSDAPPAEPAPAIDKPDRPEIPPSDTTEPPAPPDRRERMAAHPLFNRDGWAALDDPEEQNQPAEADTTDKPSISHATEREPTPPLPQKPIDAATPHVPEHTADHGDPPAPPEPSTTPEPADSVEEGNHTDTSSTPDAISSKPDAADPMDASRPTPDANGSNATAVGSDDVAAPPQYLPKAAGVESGSGRADEQRPDVSSGSTRDVSAPGDALAGARSDDDQLSARDQGSDGDEPAVQTPVEPAESDRAVAIREVQDALNEHHPDVAGIVTRLFDDKDHPLDVVERLRDSDRRPMAIATIRELANERTLANHSLDEFTAENPGRGPLFAPVPSETNSHNDGRSRKAAYIADCKDREPARCVGPQPSDDERELVADYARRLADEVMPQVWLEVSNLARQVDGTRSIRAKDAGSLHDKVARMAEGAAGREARLEYQVGDVIDAIGARITVENTERLEELLSGTIDRFGAGDGGRILELENMYASPKAHNLSYRTVPLIVAVEVDRMPYTFELQLCTRRASIASDLEHNTVYKPYIHPTSVEQDKVRRMQAEAAALDQNETRSRWYG